MWLGILAFLYKNSKNIWVRDLKNTQLNHKNICEKYEITHFESKMLFSVDFPHVFVWEGYTHARFTLAQKHVEFNNTSIIDTGYHLLKIIDIFI